MMKLSWSYYFISSVVYVIIQAEQLSLSLPPLDPCQSKLRCHECIQTPSCAWCTEPDFESDPRCFQPSLIMKCGEEYVLNPDNEFTITEPVSLNNSHGEGEEEEQIYSSTNSSNRPFSINVLKDSLSVYPQRAKLQLRVGQPYSIQFIYTQSEHYPLDVYFLVDPSKFNNTAKLITLSEQLADRITNITSNYRLGFGTFVLSSRHNAANYEYKHSMKLSRETQQFVKGVREAVNTTACSNFDASEEGVNALIQTITCVSDIGWRAQARKVLIVLTGSSFRYADDEKLNEQKPDQQLKCHLTQYGFSMKFSPTTYPSLTQIKNELNKYSVNVMFAVPSSIISEYKKIANSLEGAIVVSADEDSSNLIALVEEQYQKISSFVELKDNASSEVEVKYSTRCLNLSGTLESNNKCGGIKVGDLVSFKIDFEVKECPKNQSNYAQIIQVYPVGVKAALFIDLEMVCGCDCEQPEDKDYMVKSPRCSGVGTYKCGICECGPGSFGRFCECSSNGLEVSGCSPFGNSNNSLCSGRGQCVCGTCTCEARANPKEIIYGKFCECDNFSCERHNGKVCGGSDHGLCECGICLCLPGYTGADCSCPNSTAACHPPEADDNICSGHGQCVCGACVCEVNQEVRYSGKFCEKVFIG